MSDAFDCRVNKELAPVLLTIGSIADIAEIVERPNCAAPRS